MQQLDNVSVVCKANIYFDGKVVSHTVLEGTRKRTIGLIFSGTYTFNTDAAELMEIVAGTCEVRVAGVAQAETYTAGGSFRVPAKSSFEITVANGITEYICTFE